MLTSSGCLKELGEKGLGLNDRRRPSANAVPRFTGVAEPEAAHPCLSDDLMI